MGNTFTSSKKSTGASKVTQSDRALLDLKVQKRKLTEYQKRVENSAKQAAQQAKEHVANKNRERALVELRRKKYLDQTVSRLDDQILRVEELVISIQESVQTAQVMERLREGASALKEVQRSLRVEEVDKIMDTMSEAQMNMEQVNELLSQSLTEADDLATQEELEVLESQMLQEDLPSLPVGLKRPTQPIKEPAQTNAPSKEPLEALRSKAGEGMIRQTEPALLAA
uniref:Charged multivesicular body protein 6 n=1 Tax=Pyramimonas obovata TaxID=1411642 RepID=A0A7S0RXD5_9CHLO|mmetsp:Transcript_9150/g.18928  ORF Transcript_9150/g.18928 Transcript_9150/m.18928 type:complete len:227 (+) Transcript_9150:300-980(+)